jgi:hypothetical protein
MVEPRKPKDVQRIIKQAGFASAEADLKEFDRLLSDQASFDPSVELSDIERKKKQALERRLELLSRRLFKDTR